MHKAMHRRGSVRWLVLCNSSPSSNTGRAAHAQRERWWCFFPIDAYARQDARTTPVRKESSTYASRDVPRHRIQELRSGGGSMTRGYVNMPRSGSQAQHACRVPCSSSARNIAVSISTIAPDVRMLSLQNKQYDTTIFHLHQALPATPFLLSYAHAPLQG
jgi:hypothetical protein